MNISSSTIKFHTSVTPAGENSDALPHVQYAKQQVDDISNRATQDTITISDEARAKLAQSEASTLPKNQDATGTDKAIETIKEQIKQLLERLNRIRYDKSEQAKQERKQLQAQLNALNAVLLDFLGKKLDSA